MHKIKNIFKIKKIFQKTFLSFLVFFTFFSPVIQNEFVGFGGDNIVFAADAKTPKSTSTENTATASDVKNNKFSQSGVEIIMTIISAIVVFTMWIINWAGYLIHPSTVFDPAIIPTLKGFRILFKNMILTLSVFILIGIALKNLFKLGSIGDLGKDVGKFIVILVLINFSWFAVKFVIDIGAIAGRASFTLYDDLGGKSAFWDRGYRMYGPTIVQWTGDGKTKEYKELTGKKYDICIKYYDSKEKAKTAHLGFKKNGEGSSEKCDMSSEKKGESEAIVKNSKNIITLYPINDKEGGKLGYDLPTAILWSFIPIGEFYKIGAGTKEFGTLLTESIFSLGTAIIMIISVLAMLIIFLQRLAMLWFFLVTSPLYFFEKLLGLINESWGSFFSKEFPIDKLIAQAILVPVGFGVLYTGIAILGGELFFNNLLEQGINAYNGVDYQNAGTGNLGSVFKLIIGVGVMVGLWKGTQAVAKISGGLAEKVVETSTKFMEKTAGGIAVDRLMYSKLFTVGGNGKEGSGVNFVHTLSNINQKGSKMDNFINKGKYEYEKSQGVNPIYYNDKIHFKNKDKNTDEGKTQNYITNNIIKGDFNIDDKGFKEHFDEKIQEGFKTVLKTAKNINSNPEAHKRAVKELNSLINKNKKTTNFTKEERSILINNVIEHKGEGEAKNLSNHDRSITDSSLGLNTKINSATGLQNDDLKGIEGSNVKNQLEKTLKNSGIDSALRGSIIKDIVEGNKISKNINGINKDIPQKENGTKDLKGIIKLIKTATKQ